MKSKALILAVSIVLPGVAMALNPNAPSERTVSIPLTIERGFQAISDADYAENLSLQGKVLTLTLQGPIRLEVTYTLGADNHNLVVFSVDDAIPDGIYELQSEFSLLFVKDKSLSSKDHPDGYPCLLSTVVNVPQKQIFEIKDASLVSDEPIRVSLTCE